MGRYLVVDEVDDKIVQYRQSCEIDGSKVMRPTLTYKDLGHVERRAAILILSLSPQIGGAELKYTRKVLGWKRDQLASQFGVTTDVVKKWEDDKAPFEKAVQLGLLKLLEVEEGREGPWPGRPQISYSF